jgi:hypothetical protein
MNEFEEREIELSREEIRLLKEVIRELAPHTPTHIHFEERSMNPVAPGFTLVFTGTLSPNGAAFPGGTTFTVESSDSAVVPTVDATGLIVTVPLPADWTPDAVTITYQTSEFVPSPGTSPTSLTQTITLTPAVTPPPPPPATPTPTGISFARTQ